MPPGWIRSWNRANQPSTALTPASTDPRSGVPRGTRDPEPGTLHAPEFCATLHSNRSATRAPNRIPVLSVAGRLVTVFRGFRDPHPSSARQHPTRVDSRDCESRFSTRASLTSSPTASTTASEPGRPRHAPREWSASLAPTTARPQPRSPSPTHPRGARDHQRKRSGYNARRTTVTRGTSTPSLPGLVQSSRPETSRSGGRRAADF
jgi:hypothetical protein